jgi:hypothetical protein
MYCTDDFSSEWSLKLITPLPTIMPLMFTFLFFSSRLFSIISTARSGMYFPA